MVGAKIRLYNPDWVSPAITDLQRYDVHGRTDMYFEVFYTGTASATATEIGVAANSVDATHLTLPMQLIIVSAQATDIDTDAGKVRKIRIIGITVESQIDFVNGDEKPVYSVEEVNMNGSTDVTTVRYYLREIKAYASDWGSGGHDAEGDITIEEPADTDLLTISATFNESNGGTIYGIDGYYGRWSLLDLSHQDPDFNNA